MLLCDSRDIATSPPFGFPGPVGTRPPQRQSLPYTAAAYSGQSHSQQQVPSARAPDLRYNNNNYNQRVSNAASNYHAPQSHPPGFQVPSMSSLTRDIGRSHRNSGDLSASYTGFGSNAADLEIPYPQQKQNVGVVSQQPNSFFAPYGNTFAPPSRTHGASGPVAKPPSAPIVDPQPVDLYRTGTWNTPEKLGSPVLPTPPDVGKPNPPAHGKSKEGRSRANINITGSPPKTNPYNNHRKARKTGEVDDLYYYLDYDRRTSPQADPNRTLPDLETTLEADDQDHIFQRLNDLLSHGMFNFFAKHQFPIPIDPGKRRIRKPSDREWHEWLELAIALCEKRMIPKALLHNERIKEFVTILQNSGEIRHVVAHPSRPLKSDMGVFQLISAGIHVAQIIKDWDGMEEMLKIKENTENIIAKRRRRRESIKKHVRFLEQYAESEGLD
ncbi:hypothetical protein TWF106_005151 [Orbilia oligospora]|uniref:Uncharacterized protein n=1 Tax=Orbilia oligospora TaxID=2813651 RepID=A0A6G1LRT2_ORBOL|nr:hypothetical protein TWF788_003111 [Orbilia oligospora]KAF3196273.1 hypothetical protein TWF106_005151 [Orbilia oligospora]KAF3197246.1 hypothetical protein TWF679_003460 [Orbilia oligospora]KAF3201540.1 hypothetical protein TWF191_003262 [Orbilia oligospora]KAF3232603.1 hypothetical protein TWF192_003075 [Orbilia oligospora]